MRIVKLMLVIFILCISTISLANEVAMVTEIEGKCQITLEGETGELELAEMVSVGSRIEVGETSFLKLLHIAENREYALTENTIAEIGQNTINGSGIGKDIKLAYVDINLGEAAGQQAGTTDIARVNTEATSTQRTSEENISESLFEGDSYNEVESKDLEQPSAQGFDPIKIHIGKASTREIPPPQRKKVYRSIRVSSPAPSKTKKKDESKETYPHKTLFALPSDLYLSIHKNREGYSISLPKEIGQLQLTPRKSGDKWLLFAAIHRDEIGINTVNLNVSSSDKTYNIKLSKSLNKDVISALKLEHNEQWCQAAAIWIKLLSNKDIKANRKSIENRLQNLKQKIYESAQ